MAEQPADKATPLKPSDLAIAIAEATSSTPELIDRIIGAHARVICSFCGDVTVERMAVVDGVWTADAKGAIVDHILNCLLRPERKLANLNDQLTAENDTLRAQSAAVEALERAASGALRALETSMSFMSDGRNEIAVEQLRAALAQVRLDPTNESTQATHGIKAPTLTPERPA